MKTDGIQRHKNLTINSVQKNQESNTQYGLQIIGSAITPVAEGIKDFVDMAFDGSKGRRHISAKYIALVNADVGSFIALKTIMDSITMGQTLNKASIRIGSAMEDEYRFSTFAEQEKKLFKYIARDIEKKTNYRYRKRVLTHSLNKAGVQYEHWGKINKLHVGVKLIELVMGITNLVKVVDKHTVVKGKRKTTKYIEATETTMKWIEDKNERAEVLLPAFKPTVIAPRDWVHPFSGGYHHQ